MEGENIEGGVRYRNGRLEALGLYWGRVDRLGSLGLSDRRWRLARVENSDDGKLVFAVRIREVSLAVCCE